MVHMYCTRHTSDASCKTDCSAVKRGKTIKTYFVPPILTSLSGQV